MTHLTNTKELNNEFPVQILGYINCEYSNHNLRDYDNKLQK